MASKLYWRTGFGWMSITILMVSVLLWTYSGSALRIIAMLLTAIVAIYMLTQYQKWNGQPWARIHYRARLVFARALGTEMNVAEAEGSAPDAWNACRMLYREYHRLSTAEELETSIQYLQVQEGCYLADLLDEHRDEILLSDVDLKPEELVSKVRSVARPVDLVITQLVEDYHGRREAARYVMACVTGRAR
jgi:hypothetical protein